MFDEVRKPGRAKSFIAYGLFGAIILVFALFGITPDKYGNSSGGGSAAVVNDTTISIAEYRQRLDMVERNAKVQLDQMPPDQREMIQKELRRRTLEQMIMGEIIFQNASQKGILAADGEVRDYLFNVPIFQEEGRFVRGRYMQFLQSIGQTSDSFERQIRKELVTKKLQELFATAVMPASYEIDQLTELKGKSVNLRFIDVSPSQLAIEKSVSDPEVASYAKDPAHEAGIKKYYDEHALDYQVAEKVHARQILLSIDPQNTEAAALAKAKEIRAKLTKENFAEIAKKESKDPLSAKQGGDLGLFERGQMGQQFDQAAFSLKPGEISQPVKSELGYNIIWVLEHQTPRKVGLEEARASIAKKILAQTKLPEAMAALKKSVETGKISEVDGAAKKFGLNWEKADGVNLGSPQIPKIGDPQLVLQAVVKLNDKTGLIPNLIGARDHQYIVDVTGWKKIDKVPSKDELQRNLAYQKSSGDVFEEWIKTAEAKSTISRNERLFER